MKDEIKILYYFYLIPAEEKSRRYKIIGDLHKKLGSKEYDKMIKRARQLRNKYRIKSNKNI